MELYTVCLIYKLKELHNQKSKQDYLLPQVWMLTTSIIKCFQILQTEQVRNKGDVDKYLVQHLHFTDGKTDLLHLSLKLYLADSTLSRDSTAVLYLLPTFLKTLQLFPTS